MLANTIRICADENWNTEEKFWYPSYHCLSIFEYYPTLYPSTYNSPKRFSNFEFEGKLPERIYTKDELLIYSNAFKEKC